MGCEAEFDAFPQRAYESAQMIGPYMDPYTGPYIAERSFFPYLFEGVLSVSVLPFHGAVLGRP